MTGIQRVIKWFGIALGIFLSISIISSILGLIYVVSGFTGLTNSSLDDNYSYRYDKFVLNLDIDLSYSNLSILTGEVFYIETNDKDIHFIEKDNKLKISDSSRDLFSLKKNSKVVIYLPNDYKFDNVFISSGAGKVHIDSINLDYFDLELGAGEFVVDNIIVKEMDTETGAGSFRINNGIIGKLDFDMGVGSVFITSKIVNYGKIEAGVGSLGLNLVGTGEDYNLDISKGLGNIYVDNTQISDSDKVGNGDSKIDIDGGIGKIEVNFK